MATRRSDFGAIRKLQSSRWQVRYRDRSGRMRAAPRTFVTRGDASRWLAATRADLGRGLYFDPNAGEETLAA